MEAVNTEESVSSISTEAPKGGAVARHLDGATFLTLEHVGYFVLVVAIPIILLSGFSNAVTLWSGNSASSLSGAELIMASLKAIGTATAVMICAALLVLVPIMHVLRRRIASEYAKRAGYTDRVAYKLPVYSALGVLAALAVGSFVSMMNVFLNSLVNIGVSGVNIGDMYLNQFLPALLSFAVFGASAWYVMLFAKGKDLTKLFTGIASLLSGALVIALFVTALTVNHQRSTQSTDTVTPQPYPYQTDTDYSDFYNY